MHSSRHFQQLANWQAACTSIRRSLSGSHNPPAASCSSRSSRSSSSSSWLLPQGLSAQPIGQRQGCRLQQVSCRRWPATAHAAPAAAAEAAVRDEREVPGMSAFLDGLKWDEAGLLAVVVQVSVACSSGKGEYRAAG